MSQTKCCSRCEVTMHLSYFGTRKKGGQMRPYANCRACMRERWRLWNRNCRGYQGPVVVDRSYVPPADFLPMGPVIERDIPLRWAA